MKRKLLSITLAVAMMICMALPTYATDIYTDSNPAEIEVTLTTSESGSSSSGKLDSSPLGVEITWDDMTFNIYKSYIFEGYIWNPETLKYDIQSDNGYTNYGLEYNDTKYITVTNRSLQDITATAVFTPCEEFSEHTDMFNIFGDSSTNAITLDKATAGSGTGETATEGTVGETGQISVSIKDSKKYECGQEMYEFASAKENGTATLGTITVTIAEVAA